MEWMITLKIEYAQAILRGEKKYEIRTRIPKELSVGDTIYCCIAGTGGAVGLSFEVKSISSHTPSSLWEYYWSELGIKYYDYQKYAVNRNVLFTIGVGKVNLNPIRTRISEYGIMKAPQWFSKLPAN